MSRQAEIVKLEDEKDARKAEITKLSGEKKDLQVELIATQKEVEGCLTRLRMEVQKNKDLDEELRRSKNMWEQANSGLIGELNRAKAELSRAEERLKSTKAELRAAKEERTRADDRAVRCEEFAKMTIDDIRAEVGERMDAARRETRSDTCSAFLYTLWVNHPEMNFSFFGAGCRGGGSVCCRGRERR
ncbi:uncharacterized protein LOC127801094 [Diospyros lotus]|uniref:uncharacterized protein LOC127801094 n=1 Tax=Diospyros lotus TaxID=55363 RepID=UPI002257751A|nr:uncharacterized protein LOC127801094 [Diospyros lotus]